MEYDISHPGRCTACTYSIDQRSSALTGFSHGHIASPEASCLKGRWYNSIGRKTCFGHFEVIFLNLLNFSSTLRGARANLKRRRFILFPRTNDLEHSFFLKQSVGHLVPKVSFRSQNFGFTSSTGASTQPPQRKETPGSSLHILTPLPRKNLPQT